MEKFLLGIGFWYAIFFIVVITIPYWMRFLGWFLVKSLEGLIALLVWLVQLPSIEPRPDRGWSKVPLFSADGWNGLKWKYYSEETRQRYYAFWQAQRQQREEEYRKAQAEQETHKERMREAFRKARERLREEEEKERAERKQKSKSRRHRHRAKADSANPLDPYKRACRVLGLKGNFTRKSFQKAYRKAMLKNHPDRGGKLKKAQAINHARDVIRAKNGW